MIGAVDAINAVRAGNRGERPYSLDCPEAEQVLNIALALLVELSVANDRIDRLERHIADLRGLTPLEVRNAAIDPTAKEERREALESLQLRVLRVLVDPRVPRPRNSRAHGVP